ncbi:MAG: pro-sigmaK processing inhibitor BofA family protein [Bacillota bacterium]|jgi:inhibitor of the pro-sigma K processing machinery|nr:pro-sigmaK processing inhibitor BofA [Candidatus Fermentithermobacillaceae bacterium]
MDLNAVLGAGVLLVVVYYMVKALSRPLAGLGKIVLRSGVAFVVIWAVNAIGDFAGFHMGMNLVSALTIGVLGIPGAALLLAVKYFI